jgi:SWIM zinc finger
MSTRSLYEPLLSGACPERLKKALHGLTTGDLALTLAFQSDDEIRALATHNGHEYGINLTVHGAVCSCRDHVFRGARCKHLLALALTLLAQDAEQEMEAKTVHLMWNSGEILCGSSLTPSTRFWRNWTLNALNWSDLVCQDCVEAWLHPTAPAVQVAA